MDTLKERTNTYEEASNYVLTRKLPVAIVLNGRNFKKTTSILEKPYDPVFIQTISQTMIKLASEIEGACFLYSFNDEIVIICKNDQSIATEAWYNNNVQKMVSAASSIASISFYTSAVKNKLKLLGDPVFVGKTFVLPNLMETVNYLIAKQNECSNTAIAMLCFYELLKRHKPNSAIDILRELSTKEQYSLLVDDYELDLSNYPVSFWRGLACYRVQKEIETDFGNETRMKLSINDELKFFNKDQSFLLDILKKA